MVASGFGDTVGFGEKIILLGVVEYLTLKYFGVPIALAFLVGALTLQYM